MIVKFKYYFESYTPLVFSLEEIQNPTELTKEYLKRKIIGVAQFTGLTTKAGVELYNGDICTQKRLDEEMVFEVVFQWGMFMAKVRHIEFVLKNACENDHNHNLPIKVIGNVFNNKKLLGEFV